MKVITQIGICWSSQIIEKLLPFDFPATVIGMVLLLILLLLRVLKVEHIKEKSDFLLSNMAFFFLPAGVSIINYFDVLKSSVMQLIIICVVSTIVTFAVTAYSMRLVMYLMNRKKAVGDMDAAEPDGAVGAAAAGFGAAEGCRKEAK